MDWESYFSEEETLFYHAGYDLRVQDINSIPQISLAPTEGFLPVIKVTTQQAEDSQGKYIYFVTDTKFPSLNSEEFDFASSVEYHIGRWTKVGKALTALHKINIDIEE